MVPVRHHRHHVHLLTQPAHPFPAMGFTETAARRQGYVGAAGLTCPAR